MGDDEKKKISPQCVHDQSDPDKGLWVKPSPTEKVHAPAQKRAYCKICGKIKYYGSANVKRIGFYVNLLNELKNKIIILRKRKVIDYNLTDVQIRLIIKDLEEDDDFLDSFSNNMHNQWAHFKWIVKKRCDIDDEVLESVYCDFKG